MVRRCRPGPSSRPKRLDRPLQPLEPGSYDFARDLYFQGIGASGFVRGAIKIVSRRRSRRASSRAPQDTIQAIVEAARQVAGASTEISSGTTDLSQRTELQSAVLEKTSSSMEEISSTVRQNAENAQHANTITAQTRDIANRGSDVVGRTIKSMAHIEGSSHKIADIIVVIDEIAR